MVMARVEVNSLNIRAHPSPESDAIGSLSRGQIVFVVRVVGDWAEIIWSNGNGGKNRTQNGYVAAEFLTALRQIGGSGDTFTTRRGAEFILSVGDSDLNCREYGQGFEDCEVSLDYSYRSDYNGNDDPSIRIECEVTLSLTDVEGFTQNESRSETATEHGIENSGSIDIDFQLSPYSPIVNARISDVDCEIDDVY
ncbi:hypothetical protein CVT23_08960 [Minwuia thermotolerans]|uniref:SH3b domain-containing protein n=1 Tax=Minwuia thermotolerans TaxID=2056226 RepID=A0A2M9G2I0_9PROT|nr:hypothetical protein CVT23_08960 [Minwuia thermotolerans]